MRINHLAVVVAALAYWVLGALWYSPLLFANRFVALMRWTPEDVAAINAAGSGREVGAALLVSLVTAYFLAHFVRFVGAETPRGGALAGALLFVGFVLTTNLSTVLFEGRPLGLYLINNGYHLAGFLLMGTILSAWKRREARVVAYQN